MSLMGGLLASRIELAIGQGCCPARGTMPADLRAMPGYQVMNAAGWASPLRKPSGLHGA
jgi:hypothetical protein